MRTGLLLGSDHERIGALAALAEGRAAIALARGGAPKRYGHRDPNEDACAFAFEEHAMLVAVADGHWGARGAALALERLIERHAPRWLSPGAVALAERWSAEAPDVVLDLTRALLEAGGEKSVGRTTLALALARPDEGWWAALSMGDSHVYHADGTTVREHLGTEERGGRSTFVGDSRLDRAGAEEGVRTSVVRDATGGAIVLATDGLSEPGIGLARPGDAVAESLREAAQSEAALRPLVGARGLAERALEAQREQRSGDNVATACLWLAD